MTNRMQPAGEKTSRELGEHRRRERQECGEQWKQRWRHGRRCGARISTRRLASHHVNSQHPPNQRLNPRSIRGGSSIPAAETLDLAVEKGTAQPPDCQRDAARLRTREELPAKRMPRLRRLPLGGQQSHWCSRHPNFVAVKELRLNSATHQV